MLCDQLKQMVCFDGNWHGLLSRSHVRACSVRVRWSLNHQKSLVATECVRGVVSLVLVIPVLVHRTLVLCADVEVFLADVHIASVVQALGVDVSKPVL